MHFKPLVPISLNISHNDLLFCFDNYAIIFDCLSSFNRQKFDYTEILNNNAVQIINNYIY